jgi:hypothetical protein
MRYGILLFAWLLCRPGLAQFPPAAGEPGSTAISSQSDQFVAWATGIEVERGLQQWNDPASGMASAGTPDGALGPADKATIVSLGDGGTATLTFEAPIADGPGWDFAVFENGFPSGNGFFLELAVVEVSSDGDYFVRFPAASLTDTAVQVGSFDLLQPENLNNLAGKYESGFGTPFDLAELTGDPQLDIQAITHVRVRDVIGTIDPAAATLDTAGRAINDPWPTNFPSSGFDLDAVGVIHEGMPTSVSAAHERRELRLWPNPLPRGGTLELELPVAAQLGLYSPLGQVLAVYDLPSGRHSLPGLDLPAGWYVLEVRTSGDHYARRMLVKN